MGADRLALVEALAEILPDEHLLEGHPAVELDHLLETHRLEPLAVENDLGPLAFQDFERLLLIALRVREHLIVAELRARGRAPARVSDHGGEIPDDENRLVPGILEIPELREHDPMPEVDVGGGRVHAELDPERASEGQLRR